MHQDRNHETEERPKKNEEETKERAAANHIWSRVKGY